MKEQLSEDFARLPALLAQGAPPQPREEPAAAPAQPAAEQEPSEPARDQLGLFG